MSRIHGVGFGRLLRRLRTDAGTRARASVSPDSAASCAPHARQEAATPQAGLRLELVARLAGIEPQREDADARAVDTFIECVLTREFGTPLMSTASGQDLLRQVREAMLASPKARVALLTMLKSLAVPRGR